MPGVFFGSTELTTVGDIKVGSTDVQEVYVGSTKIFPPSGGLPISYFYDPLNDGALPGSSIFTRATVAEEFDGVDFAEVAIGVPREDSVQFVGGAKGYLGEPADTNNCTESTDFTAVWVPTGIASRVDQGVTNGLNSYLLTADTSTGAHRLQFNSFVSEAGANYFIGKQGSLRYMIMIAGGDGNNDYACFDLQTGVVSQQGAGLDDAYVVDVGGGRFKCVVVTDPADDNAQRFLVMSDTATPGTGNYTFTGASETVELFHAQYTAGNPFCMSPVFTAGSPITRVADVLDSGVVISAAFGALFDFTAPAIMGAGNTISLLGANTSVVDVLRLDDAFNVIMDDGGTPTTIGTVAANQRFKVSYGRDGTGRSASLDGATAVTGDAPASGHEGEDFELYSTAGANQARGIGHTATLYSARPSDAELEGLST